MNCNDFFIRHNLLLSKFMLELRFMMKGTDLNTLQYFTIPK